MDPFSHILTRFFLIFWSILWRIFNYIQLLSIASNDRYSYVGILLIWIWVLPAWRSSRWQPTGFILHRMLMQNILMWCRKNCLSCVGKMGHRISHFWSHFQKFKTVFMFKRWSFSLTLKDFVRKIPTCSKVIAMVLNYCLVSPHNTPHARARRVSLANARSEHHFKIHIGNFGYCRVPFNTEKVTILPIFFYKRGG